MGLKLLVQDNRIYVCLCITQRQLALIPSFHKTIPSRRECGGIAITLTICDCIPINSMPLLVPLFGGESSGSIQMCQGPSAQISCGCLGGQAGRRAVAGPGLSSQRLEKPKINSLSLPRRAILGG